MDQRRIVLAHRGERLGVPMRATRAVYACVRLLDERRRQAPRREAGAAEAGT